MSKTKQDGQPSELSNLLCRVGWHTWGKWVDDGEATVSLFKGIEQPVLLQENRCIKCNTAKRRRVYYD